MPNLTPPDVRRAYQIYPGKACLTGNAEHCASWMKLRLATLGRRPGIGRGDPLTRAVP